MALSMAFLLSVKFHKSDEWFIKLNKTNSHPGGGVLRGKKDRDDRRKS